MTNMMNLRIRLGNSSMHCFWRKVQTAGAQLHEEQNLPLDDVPGDDDLFGRDLPSPKSGRRLESSEVMSILEFPRRPSGMSQRSCHICTAESV